MADDWRSRNMATLVESRFSYFIRCPARAYIAIQMIRWLLRWVYGSLSQIALDLAYPISSQDGSS
jgi:hypothetical protein